jgi:enoyl-CoA hydratase
MAVDLRREPDRPHVAHLRIDFNDLNLLTRAAAEEVRETVRSVPSGVSVLTVGAGGAGGTRGLTAGLDLEWARDRSASEGRDLLRAFYGMIQAVRDLDAVSVCRCGAYTIGVGLELAMGCEFRVATVDAELGLPEVRIGLPTVIHGGLLPGLVGRGVANELIYTGETVSGARAAEMDLVTRAVEQGEYEAAVGELVDRLAEKSPLILREQKRVMQGLRSNGLEAGMRASVANAGRAFASHDQREGMDAFLDGREPDYEGR